jgi:hypothetical protein
MKLLCTLSLFLLSSPIGAQTLNERIRGQWLCENLVDSTGNIISVNKLAPSGYLRYSFSDKKVFISDAPFSIGSMLLVDYRGEKSLLIYNEHIGKKGAYDVKFLDDNNLILTTVDEYEKSLDFNFTKLKNSFDGLPIDNGLIVIEHFKKSPTAKVTMRSSIYIYNDNIQWKIVNKNSKRTPVFEDNRLSDFDNFLTENFVFPKDHQLDVFSEELIIDFDITKDEVNNINIIQGLRKDIDNQVISLIQKTTEKWSMAELNDNPYNLTLRFHFKFLLSLYDSEELLKSVDD